MAEILPLDDPLEELVAAIVQLTGSGGAGGEVAVTGANWEAVFDIEDDTFFFDFVPLAEDLYTGLDDYQRAAIFALGFDPVEEPGELPLLRQEYEFEPGDDWEEEAIRQLGLLALGLLRDTLKASGLDALTIRRAT